MLTILKNMFDQVSMTVILHGFTSIPFQPTTGVLQGSILSPFLYSIYINRLSIHLRSPTINNFITLRTKYNDTWVNMLLYADDCVLIYEPHHLQTLPHECQKFATKTGFQWNASKSIILNHTELTSPLFKLR